MSANINFAAGPATTTASLPAVTGTTSGSAGAGASASPPAGAASKSKSHMILPYEVLFNLVGRRVTVLLTRAGQELEGTLESVDSDKGDMLLSDVVHYLWQSTALDAEDGASDDKERKAAAEKAEEDGFHGCFGGGQRRELSRCRQAMLNSAFVALVTPTLFVPE